MCIFEFFLLICILCENSISKIFLQFLPCLLIKVVFLCLLFKMLSDDEKPKPPHFDGRARIFELDPCSGYGKVSLVYRKATPGIC